MDSLWYSGILGWAVFLGIATNIVRLIRSDTTIEIGGREYQIGRRLAYPLNLLVLKIAPACLAVYALIKAGRELRKDLGDDVFRAIESAREFHQLHGDDFHRAIESAREFHQPLELGEPPL